MNSRHANPAGARTDKEGRPSAMIATVICCRCVKLEDRATEAQCSPQRKRSRQSDSVEGMCSERHGTGRPRSCSEKPVFGKAQGGRSSQARTSQSLQTSPSVRIFSPLSFITRLTASKWSLSSPPTAAVFPVILQPAPLMSLSLRRCILLTSPSTLMTRQAWAAA